jgi:hypothetical protein
MYIWIIFHHLQHVYAAQTFDRSRLELKIINKAAFLLAFLLMHPVLASAASDESVPVMLSENNLWFEDALSEQERDMVRNSVDQAKANIVDAYGEQKAGDTLVIWCKTKACALFFGGPTMRSFATEAGPNRHGGRYTFKRPTIVILRQARAAPGANLRAVETITHELSHREFKARLHSETVPAWFNEGVATYLGKEHACSPTAHAVDNLSELASPQAWVKYTDQSNAALVAAYCQARNEVERWTQSHGGFAAVLALLDKRGQGGTFESIYGG